MHQDVERDYATDPIREVRQLAAPTSQPVSNRSRIVAQALTHRDRMKKQPLLLIILESILVLGFIFTFLSGVIFTDIPLLTMAWVSVQHSIIDGLNHWYVENGRDAFAVVTALKLAALTVALVFGYNVIHKYDLDIKTRNLFLRYIGGPIARQWRRTFRPKAPAPRKNVSNLKSAA